MKLRTRFELWRLARKVKREGPSVLLELSDDQVGVILSELTGHTPAYCLDRMGPLDVLKAIEERRAHA